MREAERTAEMNSAVWKALQAGICRTGETHTMSFEQTPEALKGQPRQMPELWHSSICMQGDRLWLLLGVHMEVKLWNDDARRCTNT